MRYEREGSVNSNGGGAAGFGRRRFYTAVALLASLFALLCFGGVAFAQTVNKTSPSEARLGETFEYRIVVERGQGNATAFLRDTLPDGVTFVEFTRDDNDVVCTEPTNDGEFTCDITNLNNQRAVIEFEVVADRVGGQTNLARVFDTDTAGESPTNTDTATTVVQRRDRNNNNNNNNGNNNNNDNRRDDRRDRLFDRFFDQYQEDQFLEDLQDAEEDLNNEISTLEDGQSNDEGTNGDDPLDENDGVSATADENGAEASTPGAFAESGGDPDELAPETSTQGDVVDEVPTSGPLPNTGGVPVAAGTVLAMVLFGAGLLAVRLVMIWRERRA